jgi:hypothetical protein
MLAVVNSGQIVERVGIAGIHGQRLLVVFPGLIESEQVMVGDTDFVEKHSSARGFEVVSVDSGCVASMNHEEIALNFGRELGRVECGGNVRCG